MASMDNVGLSIWESLPMARDIIKAQGLQERISIIASGKLVTPAEVAWALCAGATFVNSARGFMFALGCIQSLRCNRNTCPTGITTHNRRLQRGLHPADKAVKVANYCLNLRHDVGVIAHSCGVPHPRLLRRFHVRLVCPDGRSRSMSELYPTDDPSDAGVVSSTRLTGDFQFLNRPSPGGHQRQEGAVRRRSGFGNGGGRSGVDMHGRRLEAFENAKGHWIYSLADCLARGQAAPIASNNAGGMTRTSIFKNVPAETVCPSRRSAVSHRIVASEPVTRGSGRDRRQSGWRA